MISRVASPSCKNADAGKMDVFDHVHTHWQLLMGGQSFWGVNAVKSRAALFRTGSRA